MKLKEAAQQALEALENAGEAVYAHGGIAAVGSLNTAAQALRAALAEPEQPHDLSCLCGAEWNIYADGREELVEPPTKKSWVGLTVEEIFDCAHGITRIQKDDWVATDDDLCEFADTVAQVLKKKNGYGTWNKPLSKEQIMSIDVLRYHFALNGGAGPISKKGKEIIDAIERAHGIGEQHE